MLHHVATRADWDARSDTDYEPAGLAAEGFVHCSTAAQLPATVGRYYTGRSDLVLLTLDTAALTADLVWEDTSGRGERFPHIYGSIPLPAIVAVEELAVDGDGTMRRA